MASRYTETIQKHLDKMGAKDIKPAHVEGFMRLQYSTLDHLDPATFAEEVAIGVGCVIEGGVENAERNAKSFGLGR